MRLLALLIPYAALIFGVAVGGMVTAYGALKNKGWFVAGGLLTVFVVAIGGILVAGSLYQPLLQQIN